MSAQPGQITIPERLTETVRAEAGEPGLAWLDALPERFTEHLRRWGLTLERIAEPGGRVSLIGYVHREDDLSPAVLKVGVRTPETEQEHAALRQWAGRGAALLLNADPAAGVLLLERLHGDIPLRSLAEDKAMLEASGLLRRLWVDPAEGHPFATLADRVALRTERILDRRTLAPDAVPLVDEALETAAALLADGGGGPAQLLHGDFHHGNVLAADRAPWLAISPRPLVGERAFDLARLVRDRVDTLAGSPGPRAAVRRRLARLADAVDLDGDRVRGWTLLRSVDAGLAALAAGDRGTGELCLEFAGWL
ncbi:aminoglycoside phosphotransferase family protein [Kitasatospora paracochleata]|uniref:Streptomycin 6-kinase n=1 Tax=Kitasatospora paracochleata TaxID=58354 RepID=A0ABT1J0G2_9ACTN|nr:aminoglycoside phosphotransferase family protein [Kitasatospora paracochleata]MCP2310286.1 streptomycin 6-kinase [Kitasatospora paracochleata]